jgi:glycine oxidase
MPVEYRRTGRLVVALDDSEAVALAARAEEQRVVGIRVERLDAAGLREAEPAVTEAALGALSFPDHALVDNARLAIALGIAAAHAGVRVLTGRPVSELVVEGGAVRGARLGGQVVGAETVVNASGSWAGLLDQRAWLPVAPAKGQMIAFQTTPPPPLRHIVSSRFGSTVPRADGRVLHGATVEDAGYDKRVTAGAVAQLLAGALTLVPSLASCALEAPWAGLRPRCTADGLPIIGADPRWRGLYHATGHFTMGIISAPATVEAMAHLITGTPSELDLMPFAPSRVVAA